MIDNDYVNKIGKSRENSLLEPFEEFLAAKEKIGEKRLNIDIEHVEGRARGHEGN
jgi:hypothetical protein